jgi:putative oxidoreductase
MNIALLVLRVVVGGLLVGHGLQKLYGWFGGHGRKGTAAFFENVGLKPGLLLAVVAGSAELAGGLLLAFGLLVPLAALLIIAVMTTATVTVHWRNGLWITADGFEYPLVVAAVAFALAALGPGSVSLDSVLDIDWAGLEWALGAAVLGVLGGLTASALGRISSRTWPRRREPHTHAA